METPLHTLIIPTGSLPLMVPSNMVAEIVKPQNLMSLPDTEDWVLGFFMWRNKPTPVVSFELLCGRNHAERISRFVVFYPMPGRERDDYFALIAGDNPYSLMLDADVDSAQLKDYPFVAGALSVGRQIIGVPDFERMAGVFYARSILE